MKQSPQPTFTLRTFRADGPEGPFAWMLLAALLLCCPHALAQTAPVADAGPDQVVLDREDDDYEDVVLDGAASSDADGTIVSYVWSEGQTQLSTDALMRATLSVGTHTLTLTVTDDDSQSDTDTVTVTVNANTGTLQRRNLRTATPRFTRPMTLVWPANPGEADICLWEDDKFAAVSLTVDDNTAPDHDWWRGISDDTGWKITWFIIVNSLYEYSNNTYGGSWSEFQDLLDEGHDVQSHTMNHHSDDNVRPEDEVIIEYRDSKDMIEANMTGNTVYSYAWPYGEYNADIAALYATSARGTHGTPNKPESTNYLNTSSISGHVGANYIDSILYGTSGISWLGDDRYTRGWLSVHYHLVQDKTAAEAEIAYAYQHNDQLWVGLFKDVARYGQQRDSATLTVTTNTSSQIAFTLADEMDDTLFDYPLTVKVKLYSSWSAVNATQNGSAVPVSIVSYGGEDYALVKAVPDQGTVILTPGGQSNTPPVADAGTDQSVTDSDDSGYETVILDGTASADSDGSIVSYVWTENATQIATGSQPSVSLAVGAHTLTLTVTDDDSAAATDTVEITVAAPSTGRTLYVDGHTADQGIYSDGTTFWVGQSEARVGGATTLDGNYIMVFELPTLNAGETIANAWLDVYCNGLANSPTGNMDLYGLGYRASSAVQASNDYYQGIYDGDATDATALQSGLGDANTTAGWLSTDASAQAALASYLGGQYAAGASGGDYIFLRLNSVNNQSNYYYWKIATANSATAPLLTIETATDSNDSPTADAGADQIVTDSDDSGYETVTLDGTGSTDSDGSIVSYIWTENATQIATGSQPSISLAVGAHTLTLTVTDDDSAADSDTVVITVNEAPQTRTVTVYGHTDDRGLYTDGTMTWVGQAEARVGGATTQDGNAVLVFELPALATGESVSWAALDVYLNGMANSPHGNVDLYGLGYRSSSAVQSGDFYQGAYDGDITDATALQSGLANASSTAGWLSTSTAGEAALAGYVDAQYTAGAAGGDYIFVRINAEEDQSNYYYWKIATANSANVPVLTLEISE